MILKVPNLDQIAGKGPRCSEKKFIKMRKEYTVKAKGKYDVRYLTMSEFKFEPVDMSEQ